MSLSRGRCRLETLLRRKRWSQAELAVRTGYAPRMISHYVNDTRAMSVDVMKNIANALGCLMEDLYDWVEVDDTD
ncbi:helix-turn-helix domain-containing protein [Paenibacillus oryzisoli]|uniref:HTH cro/C1-type domain-containing protein n=1 Tax=Paenibacillus oryzisoli TaxID=1850517 RepID=A0A198AIV5_9BACL|nr:helix-turn-helix transcriptional regulator [Paenibacillus oryzisoli]OAS21167.1 hypothetical protein A8708_30230 [Paenibacillus oryzisoli]